MMDVQPPTHPKAFTVSTTAPPTQPKSFNRPPPTGPRLVPTVTGQLPPLHRPATPEPSSAPAPTQPDPGPGTADAPIVEEPEITLPKIEPFVLLADEGRKAMMERLDKTVKYIQFHVTFFS